MIEIFIYSNKTPIRRSKKVDSDSSPILLNSVFIFFSIHSSVFEISQLHGLWSRYYTKNSALDIWSNFIHETRPSV